MDDLRVRDAMTPVVVSLGPAHTLRAAAVVMAEHHVGAAVVTDADAHGPGILTERDLLRAVAAHVDLDRARVAEHLTPDAVHAGPDWPLADAAAAMLRGGFRHLVVVGDAGVAGVLSMRDVVRAMAPARTAAP